MNVSTPSESPPLALSTQPIQRRSAWVNLVRKECLDSREAAIAGLAIFWLVPAALELLGFELEGSNGVFRFAWLSIIGAGWLYAVIVGAHTVCRDSGKAEEHFLLAQPVSPRTVVWAKLITGAVLVAVVLGIAAGWDTILGVQDQFYPFYGKPILSATCVMAAGFAVAFATAVMTRQMLASTVVATLMLVVWAIAPLLSSRLTQFAVPTLLPGDQSPTTVVPFIVISLGLLVLGAVASVHYSTRERVFRLGHKHLAWATGLVMLTLFGGAMTEAGSSLHVRDQAMLTEPGSSVWLIASTIQRDNRFVVAYYDRPESRPMGRWSLATFRVSDSGQVQDVRRTPIPGTLPPLYLGPQKPGTRGDRLTGLTFDKDGHLVISGERWSIVSARRHSELETPWRTTLAWPDGGEPEVLSHAELALPAGQTYWTAGPWPVGRDSLPRFTYVVSAGSDRGYSHKDKLYVFDWSDGLTPGPRYVIPLPQDTAYVNVANGKVRVRIGQGHFRDWEHQLEADFDTDHPETLLDEQNWSFHAMGKRYEGDWVQEFVRTDYQYIPRDRHGDIAYLSDSLGLRVARQTHPGRWQIVGECRASPLSMLFRFDVGPKALDDSLVIEGGQRGLIAYDVSDPTNPKRIGFFNTIGFSVYTAGRYLVLLEYNLITVLDRPDRRGGGNP
jgi:hypothetical protein